MARWIPLAFVLSACGGAVTPDSPNGPSGTASSTSTSAGTGSSGTGDPTGGNPSGTTGSSGTVGTTGTTGSSGTVGTTGTTGSTGTIGTTDTATGTSSAVTTGPTTTTGTCGSTGGGGTGGAGGASGGEPGDGSTSDGGVTDAQTAHYARSLHEGAPIVRLNSAILLRYADFPPPDFDAGGTGSTSSVTTGGGPDPNSLFLVLGDAPVTCGQPYGPGGCGHWRVVIGIPPGAFHVGSFISLECVTASHSVTGPDRGGGDCSGGGGSFNRGGLWIYGTESDGGNIQVQGTWQLGFQADGFYQVERCR